MGIKNVIEAILPYGILKLTQKHLTKNIFNYFRGNFKEYVVRENSVLIIEFTSYHGEVFPGLTRYLLDLGYNVDIVFRKSTEKKGHTNRNDTGLFSCFSGDHRVSSKTLSSMDMNLLLRSSASTIYKHIIIVTFYDRMRQSHFYGVDFFKLKPVCIMHYPDITNDYFQTNKIISLVKMDCLDRKPPYRVSAHYFGNVSKKNKKGTTVFVTLNTKNLPRRNLYLLFSACDKLYKKGITNFLVKVIGDGLPIPERFHNNFQIFGFLDYQNMYKKITEADFFLALIDQASVEYTNKASGSYSLSYGFLKPIVLHRKFSDTSGFTAENSVLYNDNDDLSSAIEKCINMSNNEYSTLVSSLEISEKRLYDVSLANLKMVLEAQIQYVSHDKQLDLT